MTHTELKNKAITWLEKQSQICKTRPYRFSPKEIADEISGVHTSLGAIQNEIIAELMSRGVNIKYSKIGKKRFFELL
ncbi:MAG: hypothetical protein E6Q59_02665 [Nitrosomonas sp.]|nr:hypothetical protein [Nitrosomonas sp.]OQW84628.1 MAG: hypothetical protein BVN30_03050 [Proteobacteria bacterium ST_bin16]TXI41087.1 MAG: hypothetical protein E6Q59_02665 [Nitrosomonas sp.]